MFHDISFHFFFMSQGNVCMPGCMENAVAKQLLRLILTGTVVNIACDFFYGLIYKKLFHVSSWWRHKFMEIIYIAQFMSIDICTYTSSKSLQARRQLSIENLVIDIVYIESLVWVGSSFSPVAAFLGLFCNFITFSYMKASSMQLFASFYYWMLKVR